MFAINTLSREELDKRAKARKLRGLFYVSHEDYHAGPGWSSTRLKRVLQSPAHAAVAIKDTAALRFGRALHVALLEPEAFASGYELERAWPKLEHDGRTTEGKKERYTRQQEMMTWERANAGKVILSTKDFETIAGINLAAARSPTFQGIVAGATFEIACYWIDADTGVLCKAKADIWKGNMLADVKSTMDASRDAFRRAVVEYDYDLSASFYADGFGQILGQKLSFVWIPIEKEPPHGIAFYVADEEMEMQGRALYKQALRAVTTLENGRFGLLTDTVLPCYPDEIQAISPTAYARNRINENP